MRPAFRGALTRRSLLAGVGALAASGGRAQAQRFPSGPVKIIVGTGPGSSPDVISRVVAEHLSRQWGQQVLVINQPGGSGSISIRAAGNAPPDGHTLYFALGSNFLTLPEFRAGLPFDVAREFVPIGYVGEHPMVIATHPSLGINTLPELMDYARKRPGQLNVACGNRGSIIHLTGEWLRKAIGVDMTLVHYPGTPQAMADLLGGRIQVHVDAVSSLAGSINAGTIKALAVAARERLYNFPNLPMAQETIPGLVAMGWFAMMAPPKTPDAVARKVSDDLRAVLGNPELKKRFHDLGTYLKPMTQAELASFIEAEQKTWAPVIAAIGTAPAR
jgi:tripartite-type tricarboxylate transporter receptor subunit TctC